MLLARTAQVILEPLEQLAWQHGNTILLAFALPDGDLASAEVEILDSQFQRFEQPQARTVEQRAIPVQITILLRIRLVNPHPLHYFEIELGFGMEIDAAVTADRSPTRRIYSSHRERQRRRILEAAEKLFDERGIDRVTMSEIVNAAGIRASTLYEYFSNKDDVVWAIVGDMLADAAVRAKQAMDTAETALAKITALLEFMADGLTNDPSKIRFMAQFDAMYARQWSPERHLSLEVQLSPGGFGYFGALIRDGIADGSLRRDLDPDLTMHAVINAVIGAQRRLASLGNRVELEYGHPIDRLFRETIRVILLGLRATDSPPTTHGRKRPQPDHQRKRPS